MPRAEPSTAGTPATTHPSLFPFMAYEDAPAALDWLCRAFGFEKHLVVPGPDGTIAHAQLRLGNGMIMAGSAKGRREMFGMGLPRDCGGLVTGGVYVVVADVDRHHDRAKAAGVEIIREPLQGVSPSLFTWSVAVGLTAAGFVVSLLFFSRFRNRIVYWL